MIFPAKTITLGDQTPSAAMIGTSGTNTSASISDSVQMQEGNSTQTKAITENDSETTEEIPRTSDGLQNKAEIPVDDSNEAVASSGFGGFLSIFSLASIVYCFKRGRV